MIEQSEIQIKILRLNTGEDIIGSCLMDDELGCVNIENPMKVYVKRATVGNPLLFILPWLPLEIIEDNFATINYDDIITVIDPKKSFVEYYNNAIEEIEAKQLKDQELTGEEEDDDDVDEETMQEMLNALKESKRNRLH